MSDRGAKTRGFWSLCLVGFLLLGCGDKGLRPEEGRFEVAATSLDFGAVLQGESSRLPLEIRNLGRARTTIELRIDAPFAGPSSIALGGGEVRSVELEFRAGAGVARGRLVATDGRVTSEVALTGEGVVPLDCMPSSPCHTSTFDLATRTCVETARADGSGCVPTSLCLDAGTCVAGLCVGQPRACDDQNACTNDACSETLGCVHSPRLCPPSARVCHVATCDPDVGCGEAPAQNLSPCGAISCEQASLCMAGACQVFAPAPDGMPCGLETPCRAEATCRSGSCDVPDATPLTPVWSLPLTGAPNGPLRGLSPNVFVQTCADDGSCALESFTGIDTLGFSRWRTPLQTGMPLLGVDAVGLCTDQGFASVTFDPATGAQTVSLLLDADAVLPVGQYGFIASGLDGRLALASDGTRRLLVHAEPLPPDPDDPEAEGPDGGVEVLHDFAPDGGLRTHVTVDADGGAFALALGVDGTAWMYDADGRLIRVGHDDAGVATTETFPVDAGFPQAAIAGSRLVVGGRTLVDLGGEVVGSLALPDAGAPVAESETPWVLLDSQAAYLLARPCADDGAGGCRERASLSAYAAADGAPLWSVRLDEDGVSRTPLEASLLAASMLPITGVGVLFAETEGAASAGWVRFYAMGEEVEACRLPGASAVRAGLFQDGALYTVVERDGTHWLEVYGLAPFTAQRKGWPRIDGLSGTRREH